MPEVKKLGNTVIRLVKGDITDLEVEAFVYYARKDLELGAGFGNAISMRGGQSIREELNGQRPLEVGQVVVTSAGEMKAKYIVHAVGPKFQEQDTARELQETVFNALKAAEERGIRQIAFPPMGAGFYGLPLGECVGIMLSAFEQYLEEGSALEEIIICALDNREFAPFEVALA